MNRKSMYNQLQISFDQTETEVTDPSKMTAEQEREVDKLVDQGFNYPQARLKAGVAEVNEEVVPLASADNLPKGAYLGNWDNEA